MRKLPETKRTLEVNTWEQFSTSNKQTEPSAAPVAAYLVKASLLALEMAVTMFLHISGLRGHLLVRLERVQQRVVTSVDANITLEITSEQTHGGLIIGVTASQHRHVILHGLFHGFDHVHGTTLDRAVLRNLTPQLQQVGVVHHIVVITGFPDQFESLERDGGN